MARARKQAAARVRRQEERARIQREKEAFAAGRLSGGEEPDEAVTVTRKGGGALVVTVSPLSSPGRSNAAGAREGAAGGVRDELDQMIGIMNGEEEGADRNRPPSPSYSSVAPLPVDAAAAAATSPSTSVPSPTHGNTTVRRVDSLASVRSRRSHVQADAEAALGHMKIVSRLNEKLRKEKVAAELAARQAAAAAEQKAQRLQGGGEQERIARDARMRAMARQTRAKLREIQETEVELLEQDLQYERDRLSSYTGYRRQVERSLLGIGGVTKSRRAAAGDRMRGSANQLFSVIDDESEVQHRQTEEVETLFGGTTRRLGPGVASTVSTGISKRTPTFHIPVSELHVRTPRRLAIPARSGPSPAQLRRAARELGAPPLRRVSAIHDQANAIEASKSAAAALEEEEESNRASRSNMNRPNRKSKKRFQRNPSHVFELMSPERDGAKASKKKRQRQQQRSSGYGQQRRQAASSLGVSKSSPMLGQQQHQQHMPTAVVYGGGDGYDQGDEESSREATPTAEQAARAATVVQAEADRIAIEEARKNPHRWGKKEKTKVWKRAPVPLKNAEDWTAR